MITNTRGSASLALHKHAKRNIISTQQKSQSQLSIAKSLRRQIHCPPSSLNQRRRPFVRQHLGLYAIICRIVSNPKWLTFHLYPLQSLNSLWPIEKYNVWAKGTSRLQRPISKVSSAIVNKRDKPLQLRNISPFVSACSAFTTLRRLFSPERSRHYMPSNLMCKANS